MSAEIHRIESHPAAPVNGLGEGLRVSFPGVEDTVDAVLDDVEHSPASQGHHRRTTGQRLHRRDAEVFRSGL